MPSDFLFYYNKHAAGPNPTISSEITAWGWVTGSGSYLQHHTLPRIPAASHSNSQLQTNQTPTTQNHTQMQIGYPQYHTQDVDDPTIPSCMVQTLNLIIHPSLSLASRSSKFKLGSLFGSMTPQMITCRTSMVPSDTNRRTTDLFILRAHPYN